MGLPPRPLKRRGRASEITSYLHHLWGDGCPMTDVDAVEFGPDGPVAGFEYKNRGESISPGVRRRVLQMAGMFQRAGLPYFLAWADYQDEKSPVFEVYPLNEEALRFVGARGRQMGHLEYVGFQYGLRGACIPQDVAERIATYAASGGSRTPRPGI